MKTSVKTASLLLWMFWIHCLGRMSSWCSPSQWSLWSSYETDHHLTDCASVDSASSLELDFLALDSFPRFLEGIPFSHWASFLEVLEDHLETRLILAGSSSSL